MKGVDYSTAPGSWPAFFATLRGRGYEFIVRYLYDQNDPKRLTRPELDAAFAAGLRLGCYFETSEGACLSGYERGANHAHRAQEQLEVLGLPADLPVCFCIDIDADIYQLRGGCRRYFEGVLSVMPLERVGVYGGLRAVDYIRGQGLASYGIQTEAWSRFDEEGRLNGKYPVTWSRFADVRQWTNNGPGRIGGVSCDGLDLVGNLRLYHPTEEADDMYTDEDRKADQKSREASSYRESIALAVACGNWAGADELVAEATAKGVVIRGYMRPPQ